MAVYKFSNVGGFGTYQRYNDFLAGNPAVNLGDFESIATIQPSGSTNAVTFSNIPSTYQHLQVRAIQRDNYAQVLNGSIIRFNSDSGSNYSYHTVYGNGTSALTDAAANLSGIYVDIYASANAAANIFGVCIVDVLDYANTNKFKTVRSLRGVDTNGNGSIGLNSGNWRSTSAITSITFQIGGAGVNWNANSHFALYGIKG